MEISAALKRYSGIVLLLAAAAAGSAGAAPEKAARPFILPPASEVFVASRTYPLVTVATTNHSAWVESIANVNVAQTVRLGWHLNRGGKVVLQSRPAWDQKAEWKDVEGWPGKRDRRGETDLAVSTPTLFRLRVRGPSFPRSGIARLEVRYVRRTLAALRGKPGATRRPVIVAEGYDPFNVNDFNQAGVEGAPDFARLITEGKSQDRLDPWLLDWGDGAAPLEQQAEDFAEIARLVRAWNSGRRSTAVVGISMGAVSTRYALAKAADSGDDLGVSRYISVNGPHQGAWINPNLLEFLLKRAGAAEKAIEGSESYLIQRGLNNPAAQELLFTGKQHDAFYADLRSHGKNGYHPGIPRVAFSNGALVKEGNELADLVEGKPGIVHRVQVSLLGLPLWITAHRTRAVFKYGGYPGELLPESLRTPVRDHARLFGFLRFDWRARWEQIPTFIPTHSALDFPDALTGEPTSYRYAKWRESAFPVIYVAAGRNLPHDIQNVNWIDPRSGKGAPGGRNAILDEVAHAFQTNTAGNR